ncbi:MULTISPECIES: DNA polymerase IV [Terrabacteria group]|uniref:DNA polymerase IV n=1 Tax=Bacillati TaxID=1783272 RepID=UPI001C6ED37E|nr:MULTISPECIES: DNA polymerase IV [Terrabacteria group]MBW9211808.1 DNA polymerase IV [Trueperella sp. zg.1013]
MSRVYFHVDLNAFFASAEVLRDPSLKGKPIVVSGQTKRSVVTTASYEARVYGVHSAMPIVLAKKLCPELEIVEGHYSYYRNLSNEFMDIVHSFSPYVEKASIDECYVDMTEAIQKYEHPLDLAILLQKMIYQKTGLGCSIGIGPNLFLAKMASDMKKPMGITVLRIRDVKEKLWPLDVKEMRGIGRKTLPKVTALGIQTIGDLANYKPIEDLEKIFKNGIHSLLDRCHGIDHTALEPDWQRKSLGVSETLLEDVTDYEELRGLLRSLSKKLHHNLEKEKKVGKALSIRITYYNFRTVSRSLPVKQGIYLETDIFEHALRLFDQYWEYEEPVRLLGITITDFMDKQQSTKQLNLFEMEKKDTTQQMIDEINRLTSVPLLKRADQAKKKEKGKEMV